MARVDGVAVKQGESTSPARAAAPRTSQSPQRQFPRHAKHRYRKHTKWAPPTRTTPTTQRGSRGFVVEAFRLRRCFAGHQRAPKAFCATEQAVAPIKPRRAIVRHAAVVGVLQTRIGDVDALAVHINVAARRAAAAAFFARRAANNDEALRLSWRLAEHLRARFHKTVLYGARVAAVVVRFAIRRMQRRRRHLSHKGPPRTHTRIFRSAAPQPSRSARRQRCAKMRFTTS